VKPRATVKEAAEFSIKMDRVIKFVEEELEMRYRSFIPDPTPDEKEYMNSAKQALADINDINEFLKGRL